MDLEKLYMNEEWLRSKIIDEGLTHSQVAELCGTKYYNIRHWAKKYGIDRPGSTKKDENLKNAEKCKDRDWLYEQYIKLDKSYDTIAKEFNIGKTTVARWVKKHGLIKDKEPQFRGKRSHQKPPTYLFCDYCGIRFKMCYAVATKGRRFCSQSCAGKYQYENGGGKRLTEALQEFYKSERGQKIMKMNGVKGLLAQKRSDTSIEVLTESMIQELGLNYEKQKQLYYWVVDFYLPEYDLVIEALGDYWHANPKFYPEPNSMQKKNIRRDKGKKSYLSKCGHNYIEFWENDLRNDYDKCLTTLKNKLSEIQKSSA